MPRRIRNAPNAATMNQGCRLKSLKWLNRRVTPIRPRMYNGPKATQKPTRQNQNVILPQNSYRTRVGEGKRVSVRVDPGGRRICNNTTKKLHTFNENIE